MFLCWSILITLNFPGYGAVPSDWQVLWYQSLHKLSFRYDVLGCSCCNVLHKAGQNIIISSLMLVSQFLVLLLIDVVVLYYHTNLKMESPSYEAVIPWTYSWFLGHLLCSMKWMAELLILCLWILHLCWSISLSSFGGNLDIGVLWTLLMIEVLQLYYSTMEFRWLFSPLALLFM